jgi:hypothetical protein
MVAKGTKAMKLPKRKPVGGKAKPSGNLTAKFDIKPAGKKPKKRGAVTGGKPPMVSKSLGRNK